MNGTGSQPLQAVPPPRRQKLSRSSPGNIESGSTSTKQTRQVETNLNEEEEKRNPQSHPIFTNGYRDRGSQKSESR